MCLVPRISYYKSTTVSLDNPHLSLEGEIAGKEGRMAGKEAPGVLIDDMVSTPNELASHPIIKSVGRSLLPSIAPVVVTQWVIEYQFITVWRVRVCICSY